MRHNHHQIKMSDTSSGDKVAQFSLTATLLIYFTIFFFFLDSPFPFLIFQRLRCSSSSLKRPWGLQVLAFVSHFLLKLFFFNLFTVVVLALSSLSRFLLRSPYLPKLSLCQPEVNASLFSSACKQAGGIFLVIVT